MEFQKVLDSNERNLQALLAPGVSEYQEGLASERPADRRRLLEAALANFEGVLRRESGSDEARYNIVLALHTLGRIKEADREMQTYYARDNKSIWAQRLRSLQGHPKIQSNQ
jgi:hypothetical protein